MKIEYDISLKPYTTFKIGGAAKVFVTAESAEDICKAVKHCDKAGLPLQIIGGGSNLLVSDGGLNGVTLYIGRGMDKIEVSGETIQAEAGARLSRIAAEAERNGLTGLEWAAHIPGTLGGGIYMNAGAFGGDMSGIIKSVTAADERGINEYPADRCGFSYRGSIFQRNGDVITGAEISLKKGEPEKIREKTGEYLIKRAATQPLREKSAGSVFKAADGVPAGRLIDNLGLKGYNIGGACISYKHANFIINTGAATYNDVVSLITYIQARVFEAYNIRLEPEIKIL